MNKQYLNLSILLFAGWTVYASCQQDHVLALAAGGIVVLSFLLRLRTADKQFAFFERIPLSTVIILSLVAGFIWRSIFPPPPQVSSPFPEVTGAVQAGSIFAAILIWLKPFTRKNIYQLTFLAWLTATVSINLPFEQGMLFTFCAFCVIGTAFVLLHTMKEPKNRKYIFLYYRHYVVFASLLLLITMGLFFGVARSVSIFDQAFMSFAGDYLMPRAYTNFLKIDPRLKLISPGRSGWDKRPALEITVPDVDAVYLKMQVFKDFDNGTWAENPEPKLTELPAALDGRLPKAEMTMFAPLERIIPSIPGIKAVRGIGDFAKGDDGIVYSENKQRTRILEFSFDTTTPRVILTPEEYEQYTRLPADIAAELKELSAKIVGSETDPIKKAGMLQNYFLYNFQYSLSVGFRADNNGIVEMIKKRYPAYCSYFATALALLLRAEGIPARIATGFLTHDKIDPRANKFLARVLDAHAWTGAYLPQTDPKTGEKFMTWKIFDPTPAAERLEVLDDLGIQIARLTDRMWLSALRFGAFLENLDKEKLKKDLLVVFISILVLSNRKHLARGIGQLLGRIKKESRLQYKKNDLATSVYHRYENYLKTAFAETRQPAETDKEVLLRLKTRADVPGETIEKMESFIRQYHAARFGERQDADLQEVIEEICR